MINRPIVLLNGTLCADELGGILDDKNSIAGRLRVEKKTWKNGISSKHNVRGPERVCERIR